MKNIALAILLIVAGTSAADDGSAAGSAAGGSADVQSFRTRPPEDPQKACFALLNTNPAFAKAIVESSNRQIDQQTVDAHDAAIKKVAQDESHVVYAYAALWVIVALLVAFMWMRQQKLKVEIEALRRDLSKAEAKS